jgi:hypothetical protein
MSMKLKTHERSIRCTTVLSWLALVVVAFVVHGESSATEIFVSIDGHAQADGSLAKPYGSLPDAVKAVRALRQSGETERVTIVLRAGRHQLNQTLVLGMQDSAPAPSETVTLPKYGAGDNAGPAHLTFAAYPGEKPVVSAGVPVTGWKLLESASSVLP